MAWLSWTDISARIISNKAVLVLLITLLPFCWMFHKQVFLIPAMITFVIGFLLFILKVIGGGDVKLITVLMLAIPYKQVTSFLFLTSFFGLLLVIFGWLFFRKNIKKQGLPYGVAISLGFLTNFWLYHSS
ncbi:MULTISPECIES: A24 family peptidase [Pasteurellaceae]|uniref:Prepilin peptidase n=1 Tax=Pasteurella atlantica TaxID=2827233 RepID=A0AAW8CMQ2_9PAST|nr:prepilin peptidase [Pasteurella atlantica]MDP8039594.1 prepilin peptidase [Pasteurella atlantica]MDP8041685.1 prepilin peptidase [Pasteurella atlantica]MDP8045906.1 prepilin peptidase [Pasteurella atlantica]MDP8061716.1 prepilin peptidase [Pasteurella atlantica]MDP8089457.1 prepilin peptidase [Pasteurella atlantica]